MGWPEDGDVLIKSFSDGSGAGGFRLKLADVENVELLGYDGQPLYQTMIASIVRRTSFMQRRSSISDEI